ncbi:hypothetical protein LOD99_8886 [Oopsacas minuta]|uniref:Uncharacterized protein n=1 Tax=Oopsacas minuta TaxID=111878 RepID=A0AAV7JFB2_9METZ|nr:hypothetical protein LOD99_8886 [Oopsacas minuta]
MYKPLYIVLYYHSTSIMLKIYVEMATALINEIPASGPVSLMPVSNKLQDRMNILRDVIDSKKTLVRNVGEEMKRLIEQKTDRFSGNWKQSGMKLTNE